MQEYKNAGATFAKWRAIYTIGENIPSRDCMKENAVSLAKYAFMCQELDIVPIIEPEILMDGGHSIEECYKITAQNFDILFSKLQDLRVFIPGVILKTSMVIPGKEAKIRVSSEKIAEMTIKCLKEHASKDIGGIVFLSGGQSDKEATLNLNAMHQIPELSWPLTFSYGRAIQNEALQSWAQNPNDISGAQTFLVERAKANSLASVGEYKK